MSKYTVRVELHGAEEVDYEILHKAMHAKGFLQTIEDGTTFKLPTAEYNYVGAEEDKGEVLDMAKDAAAKTKLKFSILVTKSAGRTWYNLGEV